jgi:hypothetical protein
MDHFDITNIYNEVYTTFNSLPLHPCCHLLTALCHKCCSHNYLLTIVSSVTHIKLLSTGSTFLSLAKPQAKLMQPLFLWAMMCHLQRQIDIIEDSMVLLVVVTMDGYCCVNSILKKYCRHLTHSSWIQYYLLSTGTGYGLDNW